MTPERTHYEATLDVRYAARYGLLQRRFFGTIQGAFTLVELLGGSAAFAAWVANRGGLAAAMGLVLAVVAALNHTIKPAEQRALCAEMHRRYTELDRQAPGLSLLELDERLKALRENDVPEIEALRAIAYNDALRENGREDALMPETRWQRLVAFLA